ncbi:MAG: hypothetical protein ABJN69_05120 [Hellea sp.]
MINEDVRHIVEVELQPNEKLLWADKPAKFPISFMGIYVLLFSIVWCVIVFSLFGAALFGGFEGSAELPDTAAEEFKNAEVSASAAAIGGIMGLAFVSIFVGAGLFNLFWGLKMTIGPAKQLYAITTHRIVIFDRFLSSRVASIQPEQIGQFERSGNERIGSLSFGESGFNMFAMNAMWKTPLNKFQKISNPREVEALIRKTFLS